MPWIFRLINPQSYDFGGISPEQLDIEFDLVLILENFEESLILLKKELCMESEEIAPFINNVYNRNEYDFEVSKEDWEFIDTQLISKDLLLYKKALKTFDDKIIEYGNYKMQRQIQKIKWWVDENSVRKIDKHEFSRLFEEGRLPIGYNVNDIRGYYEGGVAWCPNYDINNTIHAWVKQIHYFVDRPKLLKLEA